MTVHRAALGMIVSCIVACCTAALVLAPASTYAQDGEDLGTPVVGQSTVVSPGQQPAVAYLDVRWPGGQDGSCTAALVDPEWILTAAHCVMLEDGTHASRVDVAIGSVDVVSDVVVGPPAAGVEIWESDGWVIRRGASIGPNRWYEDLAMVHIDGTSAITPLGLATDPALVTPATTPGTLPVEFYGYGLHNCPPQCDTADGLLRTANSTIYSDTAISQAFRVGPREARFNFFLFPNLATQGGGCFGDSGGPVLVSQNGTLAIAGVSSFIISGLEETCAPINPTNSILHGVADLVGSDLGDWVRSIIGFNDTCAGVPVEINGSTDDDIIVGTSKANVMDGRGGKDQIFGAGGADVICGGASGDDIRGGQGRDIIRGEKGDDNIRGQSSADNISGGKGDDQISGGTGPDILHGKSGKDSIEGDGGDDEISGGSSGDDIRGNAGSDDISGNSGHDDIRGGKGPDQLNGGKGNDDLFGNSGDDELEGKSGNDLLDGGTGSDSCKGGSGTNVLTNC